MNLLNLSNQLGPATFNHANGSRLQCSSRLASKKACRTEYGKENWDLCWQNKVSDGYGPENESLQIDASVKLAGRSKNSWACLLHCLTSLFSGQRHSGA